LFPRLFGGADCQIIGASPAKLTFRYPFDGDNLTTKEWFAITVG
jgi:hypothetical protein